MSVRHERYAARLVVACGTDNDGFPTCMGDGARCGPNDTCDFVSAAPEAEEQCLSCGHRPHAQTCDDYQEGVPGDCGCTDLTPGADQ